MPNGRLGWQPRLLTSGRCPPAKTSPSSWTAVPYSGGTPGVTASLTHCKGLRSPSGRHPVLLQERRHRSLDPSGSRFPSGNARAQSRLTTPSPATFASPCQTGGSSEPLCTRTHGSQQVRRPGSTRHAAAPQLAVAHRELGSAESRAAVCAQRRHGLVHVGGHRKASASVRGGSGTSLHDVMADARPGVREERADAYEEDRRRPR